MYSKVALSALVFFSSQIFLGCDRKNSGNVNNNDSTPNVTTPENAASSGNSSAPSQAQSATSVAQAATSQAQSATISSVVTGPPGASPGPSVLVTNIFPSPDQMKIDYSITYAHKLAVRDQTKRDVVPLVKTSRTDGDFDALADDWKNVQQKMSDFSQTLKDDLKALVLYTDPTSPGNTVQGAQGKFDVLMIRTTCSYDKDWNKLSAATTNNPFWIIHTNAIDISQSDVEFNEYSQPIAGGRLLDRTKYLGDMKHIAKNALLAAVQTGVDNVIWFPFGMGAFMVNLPTMDTSFDDAKMKALKKDLVTKMRNAYDDVKKTNPKLKLFICVPLPPAHGPSKDNHDAFVEIFANVPDVTLYDDADAFLLGQYMSNNGHNVAVLNGGNKWTVGNKWFDDGAEFAIDENIVRRSPRMGAVAFVLNHGKLDAHLRPLTLELAVKHYVGAAAVKQFSDL